MSKVKGRIAAKTRKKHKKDFFLRISRLFAAIISYPELTLI